MKATEKKNLRYKDARLERLQNEAGCHRCRHAHWAAAQAGCPCCCHPDGPMIHPDGTCSHFGGPAGELAAEPR